MNSLNESNCCLTRPFSSKNELMTTQASSCARVEPLSPSVSEITPRARSSHPRVVDTARPASRPPPRVLHDTFAHPTPLARCRFPRVRTPRRRECPSPRRSRDRVSFVVVDAPGRSPPPLPPRARRARRRLHRRTRPCRPVDLGARRRRSARAIDVERRWHLLLGSTSARFDGSGLNGVSLLAEMEDE